MNPIIRNILALVVGVFVGHYINGGIIKISPFIISPPEGVGDLREFEVLKTSMHLMNPQHFILPFLAHALGTFFGALVAAFLAVKRKMLMALLVGILFLIGGIIVIFMLPSPLWFTLVDLIVAYIPMAYLAGKIQLKTNS